MQYRLKQCAITAVIVFAAASGTAQAARLELSPDAPVLAHIAAAILLYAHIGGGTIGMISGLSAILVSKGARLHRAAGKTFLLSMFVAYLIGAGVAPFLSEGQRPNFIGGILALYLLITGVGAARRRDFEAGRAEIAGLAVATLIVGAGVAFMIMAAGSDSGTVDGSPPQAFFIFVAAGSLAACGEINALVRRKLPETARIVRHLWRMCFSFFIASASLFLGQPQVFPRWFNESVLPAALAFLPLAVLVIWSMRVRLGRLGAASAAGPNPPAGPGCTKT